MQYRKVHSHSKQSGADFFRKSKCDFLRMNCFGQSALGFQNKNITFRLVAPFPPVLTTAILFPRTSTNSKFNDREITFRVNITIFSEEKKSDWRICAVGARKFWVFEGLSARSSHESEISVPRGRWGGGGWGSGSYVHLQNHRFSYVW